MLRQAGLPLVATLSAVLLIAFINARGGPANAHPAVAGAGATSVTAGLPTQASAPKLASPHAAHRSTDTTVELSTVKVPTKVPTTGTASAVPPAAGPKTTAPPAKVAVPHAISYVLVDVGTGNVLAGHNERLRLPPASLTKVLTALIAIGYLSPDEGVAGTVVSEAAYPNRVGMEKGVPWPLPEVLQSLLVYSANDAAYAIADRVSGTLRGFAPVMERSALQIGMTDDPQFRDPAGLDGPMGFQGGNLVSARDLAIAGRDLLGVPELAQIVREKNHHFVDPKGQVHWLPSMNFSFLDSYPGAIGIKTGFTDRAGACIMAAATRHSRTMLAVVLNGYNPTQTAIDLLNEGFATPVSAEHTTDRLPPRKLPGPPKVVPVVQALNRGAATAKDKPRAAVSCAKVAGPPHPGSPHRSPAPPCSSRRAA